jgi:hypothetical protein
VDVGGSSAGDFSREWCADPGKSDGWAHVTREMSPLVMIM